MRLPAVVAAASLAASVAFAQTADPERDASRPPSRQQQSRAGTVTNPPGPGAIGDAGSRSGEPESPASRAPATPPADGAVKQQALEQRRAALEHCQTMTGESRTDCVRRADAEYRRATSDDTLSGERAPDPALG
jgi:hypothetical protein